MKTLILSSSISPLSKSWILCKEMETILSENHEVKFIDARDYEILPKHRKQDQSQLDEIEAMIEWADNLVIGMGVHCYSLSDNLKVWADNLLKPATGKFYGILCAAGGGRSYLATTHLTQILMNEYRMMQLPRVVYASAGDFEKTDKPIPKITNPGIIERLQKFAQEFSEIGQKLAA